MSASCSVLSRITVGQGRVLGLHAIDGLSQAPLPGWLFHQGNLLTRWALCMPGQVDCLSYWFFAELRWSVVYADPAAPISQSARETQEVDKTATPPPQETPAIQGLQEGQSACCSQRCACILYYKSQFSVGNFAYVSCMQWYRTCLYISEWHISRAS